jgi:nicotinamidase-related amidase
MTEPPAPPTVVHPSGVIPQGLVDLVVARRGGRLHMYDWLDGLHTAFVVVDLDEGSCERAAHDDRIYAPVNAVAAAVRDAGGVVAFVTTSIPSPDWLAVSLGVQLAAERYAAVRSGAAARLAPRLDVSPRDLRAVKARASAFFPANCDLHVRLQDHDIEHVLVGGMATNITCESTARDAYELGYEVTLVSDALIGEGWGLHEVSLASLFSMFGDVRPSADVIRMLGTADDP